MKAKGGRKAGFLWKKEHREGGRVGRIGTRKGLLERSACWGMWRSPHLSVRHKRLVQEEERANASRDEEQQRELPSYRVMGVWQRKSTWTLRTFTMSAEDFDMGRGASGR